MAMLLTLLCMSALVFAISCVLLSHAINDGSRPDVSPDRRITLDPPRFFGEVQAQPREAPQLPLDLLLSQLERHVRLEQAAAENFLEMPTHENLHSVSASRFVN